MRRILLQRESPKTSSTNHNPNPGGFKVTFQQSELIGDLSLALSKAQAAIQGAAKDSKNPFFKSDYADLASVIFSIKEPLAANDLAFVQFSGNNEKGWPEITTQLSHKSGQWMRNTLALEPKKRDPQGMGSALTYARRYSLASMVGIPQVDDDGNEASRPRDSGSKTRDQSDKSTKRNYSSRERSEKTAQRNRPLPSDNPPKQKALRSLEDAKRAFPELDGETKLNADDFGSCLDYKGSSLVACRPWQDDCVALARKKGLKALNNYEQALSFWAKDLISKRTKATVKA